ncbi:Hsp20/alpha crystallin family protein [Woeseia oceani]|uniref:Heat-shock protein Hsp20 n=1 Tax=Woeseia oceani TaxID=1548547 RepID=A0A193LFV7_9GAMM|nr:Hsp20/alpha crystallin family protein [Woeseia oceani]ANO51387.1 heat-shock protein Hsp20 [Woeseia oceani]
MSLIRYEPWRGVSQLQDEINRLFDSRANADSSSATADWVPSVDINEFEDSFQLQVDLPGVDPKEVEVTLDGGVLTIAGERKFSDSETATPTRRRAERAYGRFYRRFILPDTVDGDKVEASNRHGVIEISIPKQAKALPRRISVAA